MNFLLGSFNEVSIIQIVWYMLTILVGGGFLKRLLMNAKIVDSGGQEMLAFPQLSCFSVSILKFSKVML